VSGATIISLGRRLPDASSGLTREPGRATRLLSYSALLQVGFTEPTWSPTPLVSSYLTVSPLPPCGRRSPLCGTVRGVAPPGTYPAPGPVEPGLSSRHVAVTGDRPAFSGALVQYIAAGITRRATADARAGRADCRRIPPAGRAPGRARCSR